MAREAKNDGRLSIRGSDAFMKASIRNDSKASVRSLSKDELDFLNKQKLNNMRRGFTLTR